MKFTNADNIPLPFAIMLADESGYDFVPAENKISATTIMQSTRKIVLTQRYEHSGEDVYTDIGNLVSSTIGTAIHAGMERSLLKPHKALENLGYPSGFISRVKINPTQVEKNDIPMWIELRTERVIDGMTISGCADLIIKNQVQDLKTTGIFAWTSGSNEKKYQLQLSIYKWLNQDKVTHPVGVINFFFRDWSKLEAGYKPGYPSQPMMAHDVPLLTLGETEDYLLSKVRALREHIDTPEPELPECSSEDLWQTPAKWQYFGSVGNVRASKNFDTELEAQAWLSSKGKGEVRYKAGDVKACSWCPVRSMCSQAADLEAAGILKPQT